MPSLSNQLTARSCVDARSSVSCGWRPRLRDDLGTALCRYLYAIHFVVWQEAGWVHVLRKRPAREDTFVDTKHVFDFMRSENLERLWKLEHVERLPDPCIEP